MPACPGPRPRRRREGSARLQGHVYSSKHRAGSRLPPPGRKRRWAASPGGVGRGLGSARQRSSARRKWRPYEVRGAGSTHGCSSRDRGSASWRTGTASSAERQCSSFAPFADRIKASGNGLAAAQGGVGRCDAHLAWKPLPPCPCSGCWRGASARSPFPRATGLWVLLFWLQHLVRRDTGHAEG